ncbi:MAG: ion channel [Chloroflexota bacterium]
MANLIVQKDDKITPFSLFMIFLNIFAVIVALLTFTFSNLPEQTRDLMIQLDTLMSVILLADFVWRFSQLERSQWRDFWLPWGFVDLLGCMPAFPILRIFRLVRLFRLFQGIREIGSRQIWHQIREQWAASYLWGAATLSVPLVLLSGWWIQRVEQDSCAAGVSGAICTFGDGVWWAFVTVTTVGYGDRFPVSSSGRLLAGILMTIGVGIFGLFTSYIATVFIRQEDDQIEEELENVKQELAEIKELLKRQERRE